MIDEKKQILLDPSKFFKHPQDVLKEKNLSEKDKKEILHRWAYDINEMSVAEEENMPAADNTNYAEILRQIHKALAELGEFVDEDIGATTKHGSY